MSTVQLPVPATPIKEDLNSFRIAMRQFDYAAEKCGLEPDLCEVLRRPRRALSLSLPVITAPAVHAREAFAIIPTLLSTKSRP